MNTQWLLTLLLIASISASAGDLSVTKNDDELIGNWQIKEIKDGEGNDLVTDNADRYFFWEFIPVLNLVYAIYDDEEVTGNYKLDGDKLTINIEGNTFICKIKKLNKKELVLDMQKDGEKMKSTFIRQPISFHRLPQNVEHLKQNIDLPADKIHDFLVGIGNEYISTKAEGHLTKTTYKNLDEFGFYLNEGKLVGYFYKFLSSDDYASFVDELDFKDFKRIKRESRSEGDFELYKNGDFSIEIYGISELTSRGVFVRFFNLKTCDCNVANR